MATPRIFISSTCYDLQEIRFQLRKFVEDFGLEPVMSEFGDIFYNFDKHVQESCKDEIEKCDVRCSNCHRKRTIFQLKSWRYKLIKGGRFRYQKSYKKHN